MFWFDVRLWNPVPIFVSGGIGGDAASLAAVWGKDCERKSIEELLLKIGKASKTDIA